MPAIFKIQPEIRIRSQKKKNEKKNDEKKKEQKNLTEITYNLVEKREESHQRMNIRDQIRVQRPAIQHKVCMRREDRFFSTRTEDFSKGVFCSLLELCRNLFLRGNVELPSPFFHLVSFPGRREKKKREEEEEKRRREEERKV